MKRALVFGAGGFIGSHLVTRLKKEGYWVRGIDLKLPEFSETKADEFEIRDLRDSLMVEMSVLDHYQKPFYDSQPIEEIYQLAADMGGAGYVFTGEHDADILLNSALINLNLCKVLSQIKYKGKVFYSSSACIYPQERQQTSYNVGLKETYAYPANPDSEYGWEKLFSERLFLAYAKNYNLNVCIARFHNIYGPEGTYKGGKEKAPAAICRKVVEADKEIDIWGVGNQTRSFLYIDECIEGVRRLMKANYHLPINIGSSEMISINYLAKMIIEISGKPLQINHVKGPTGVAGRNSDNTLIQKELGWQPTAGLRRGLVKTYEWIKEQYGDRD